MPGGTLKLVSAYNLGPMPYAPNMIISDFLSTVTPRLKKWIAMIR